MPRRALFLGGSPTEPVSVVQLDLTTGQHQVLRRSTGATVDAGCLWLPREVEFPTEHGLTAYGIFYPPQNRDAAGPPGERPH